MGKENKRTIIVLIGFCLLFISLVVYMSYFQIFKAEKIKHNSYNKRLWINEESTLRGSILDRNDKVLAYSEKEGESYKRHYNYGRLYSHIIGYSYREYGKTGLELKYNNILLDISENDAINEIKNIVYSNKEGNNIKLTIDHGLQSKARELLNGKRGSIVALNPITGEVYTMVSMPDFDSSKLREEWKIILEDSSSPLLNRATQWLYPPGSIFKLITAISLIGTPEEDRAYDCIGNTTIDGYNFKDYKENGHGEINLEKALVHSCNTYFADKSIIIGKDKMGQIAENFLINKNISFDLPVNISNFPYKDNLGKTDIAASAIGQGKVEVTPLNMALLAAGIANNGDIVKPTLIKEVILSNGRVRDNRDMEIISQGTDPITAEKIKEIMVKVVDEGTGKNAKIKNVKVAGKTGTAQNQTDKSHAWFIGFAPADNPKVAVAIVLEEEGATGGSAAAPIGRDIMKYVIDNINN